MPERIRSFRSYPVDISLQEADVISLQVRTPVSQPPRPATFWHGCLQESWKLHEDGTIKNPIFYGPFVNNGIGQRPRHFVEQSIPEIAERLVRKVLKQFDQVRLLDLPKSR